MAQAPIPTISATALASELRSAVGKLKRRMREQAAQGRFSPTQVAVLHRLEKDGAATVSALARAEGMRSQSMGAVVAALASEGFLKGAPDPDDGRQTLWWLTSSSRRWIDESRATRQDWLACSLQSRLSVAERAQVSAAVALLARLVDD